MSSRAQTHTQSSRETHVSPHGHAAHRARTIGSCSAWNSAPETGRQRRGGLLKGGRAGGRAAAAAIRLASLQPAGLDMYMRAGIEQRQASK